MRRNVVAGVVLIILVVSAGVIYRVDSSSMTHHTTVNTTSIVSSTQSTSFTNNDGLQFIMSSNASSVAAEGSLSVSLVLKNTLGTSNKVTAAADWRLTNQSENGPSMNCAQNDPFRTEVLQGNYDLGNFSDGSPLVFTVFQPPLGFNQCLFFVEATNETAPPLFYTLSQNYYIFEPMSDNAQWIATGFQTADQPAVMGESVILEPRLFTNSTGVFTVVSGDEWGDLQVMHFVVEA